MKKYLIVVVAVLVVIGAFVFYAHIGYSGKNGYISSKRCANCHQSHYFAWSATLHPRIFRPVSKPEDIVGDFSILPASLSFDKSQVEYVVGNKWEQVYARKVKGDYVQFPAKWMITSREWKPIKDWQNASMSQKCNGCHTTGFDAATFDFVEFGVGCESCHGPGAKHVSNRDKASRPFCSACHGDTVIEKDIVKSVNSAVCGQCHSRGTNTDKVLGGAFNFPLGYKPGDDVNKQFNQIVAGDRPDSEYWWGNGVSRNRHQEFLDWQTSKHARALILMEEKYTEDRGKKTDECLRCHSADYRLSAKGKKPTLKDARYGVTCVSCHDPHGFDKFATALRDTQARCGGCHADSMSAIGAKTGKKHYPCPSGRVTCADCHMPFVVASGGGFTIRSHSFKVITPADTIKYGVPNSCQNGACHRDKDAKSMGAVFDRFYPKKGKSL